MLVYFRFKLLTSSLSFWLLIAKMEMDCNLKNQADFLKK